MTNPERKVFDAIEKIIVPDSANEDVRDLAEQINDRNQVIQQLLQRDIDHLDITNGDAVFPHTDIDDINAEFRGAVKETIDITVDASGTDIQFTLQGVDGTDLNIVSDIGMILMDTTPAVSVALTAGTSTIPQENFVYIIDNALPTLTVSTSDWPDEWHAPVARVLVLDRVKTDSKGALKVHAYTDHFSNNDGHISHIGKRIRRLAATWISGVELTPTPAVSASGATMSVATASGIIFQMHDHAMPAIDSSSDGIFIPNHPTPYLNATDLGVVLVDANNVSLTNRHYALVIWGVVSEKTGDCQLFCNLPTDSYTTEALATRDVDKFSVYTIPSAYAGTGFLIARLVVRNQADTTFHMNVVEDLRGLNPSVAAGGGAGIIFADLNNQRVTAWHDESIATNGNALAHSLSTASQRYQTFSSQTPNADLDAWTNGMWLESGTYTFNVLCVLTTGSGKLDLTLGGITVFTAEDFYSATPTKFNTIKSVGSIVIVDTGWQTIVATVNGKNGASVGHRIVITKMWAAQASD